MLVKPMSVARKSVIDPRRRSRRPGASPQRKKAIAPQPHLLGVRSRTRDVGVESLPNSQVKPVWLRSLLILQRGSNPLAFFLVAATLGIYAWTVSTQKLWTQEYTKLDNLQRQERQMTAANEVMKNQLAQLAEKPNTGLVPPSPANTLFLPPAPQRSTAQTATPTPEPAPSTPMGY